ncbi:hypothetical protein FD754_007126 [Muntiacus muntjak]|uniref:Small EDRK-rich factor 2 n=1 Tax=Muntiacus muntjak TaxID=9888 RepID=A0A5N3WME3_MUNMU|nr:hypothetical protein FD754_007126 [Muntiacus muntjak]
MTTVAVDMTRGNQRELARQKNMKKQSNSVKRKRRDDRLPAAARKQRDSEIMQQNPSSFVASCPALSPCACVPGASPITPAVSPVELTAPAPKARPSPWVCAVPSVLLPLR